MPAGTRLDHVTIVTDDFEASRAVYDPLLAAIGLRSSVSYQDPEAADDDPGTVAAIGYGHADAAPVLWLVAGLTRTERAHVALAVADRAAVQAAHQAALGAGARVVQPPREWEDRQLNYFGGQFADHAGNLIEVLASRSGPSS
jgi:catechol 2,3-dioxygenase-like lactoylglutathione lyase family enzyme